MSYLTVPSSLVMPLGEKRLTPAMVTALWVIADQLDHQRVPASTQEAVWVKIPSSKLRGQDGRDDNVWLRECLERLTGVKVNGEYRGDPWGAVVIAEWHIEQGGSLTRILVPPAAIQALRAPGTFAKIEAFAAYKLQGPARRLYAALADKKRLRQKYWVFGLVELRHILGVENKRAYERWNNFRYRVLDPAVTAVNDYGTVKIKMTPEKVGRAISSVRFDWDWKSLDDMRETDEANEAHSSGRGRDADGSAPPLTDEQVRLQEYKEWQAANNGGSYSDFLTWKKDQAA